MQPRRQRRPARQNEVLHGLVGAVDLVDPALDLGDMVGGHRGDLVAVRRVGGRGQVGADVEQSRLDFAEEGGQPAVQWSRSVAGRNGQTEPCVELVDGPEGLDTRMVLARALATKEVGGAVVTAAGVEIHVPSRQSSAAAPAMISISSVVIIAWRARL